MMISCNCFITYSEFIAVFATGLSCKCMCCFTDSLLQLKCVSKFGIYCTQLPCHYLLLPFYIGHSYLSHGHGLGKGGDGM